MDSGDSNGDSSGDSSDDSNDDSNYYNKGKRSFDSTRSHLHHDDTQCSKYTIKNYLTCSIMH